MCMYDLLHLCNSQIDYQLFFHEINLTITYLINQSALP